MLVVGVTGHRWNKLRREDEPALRARIREVLAPLGPARLCTMLAEGADRLAAEEALALGWEIEAVLPFEQAVYERDFPESVAEFRGLLASCREVRVAASPGYLEGGLEMLGRSEVLVAVWDGKEAAGEGGSGDIAQRAVAAGKRCLWIGALGPHEIREL